MSHSENTPRAVTVQEAGARGGRARAANLTPEERSQISSKASKERWSAARATHAGTINIGSQAIACAVLEDGRRVINQESFTEAIGRARKQKGGRVSPLGDGLPPFLAVDALKPFITNDLRRATVVIPFRTFAVNRKRAFGYEATLLPKVCVLYLKARDAGRTTAQQEHIVQACDMIIRGLAEVGIIALVDEATGYQEIRDRRALQAILDQYLLKEFATWAKRFPDAFYKEIFRLRGWAWNGMKINRPQCVAQYTNDLVYERLTTGILAELQNRNPVVDGARRVRHHQFLTESVGHPELNEHIKNVLTVMRLADNWPQFMRMMDRTLPRKGHSIQAYLFPIDQIDINEEVAPNE